MPKIYTKTGDQGETCLIGGRRVSKADERLEALGAVDELNSAIGLARARLKSAGEEKDCTLLATIQRSLIKTSTELAGGSATITEKDTKLLEKEIDVLEEKLPQLQKLILPGGTKTAAILHMARATCRRAERRIVALKARRELVKYFNRLGDLLFMLARSENKRSGVKEEVA